MGAKSLINNLDCKSTVLLDKSRTIQSNPNPCRGLRQGFSGGPIEFSTRLAQLIHSYLCSISNKDMRFEIVPDNLVEMTGNELKRFMCALQAYKDSPNPVIPTSILLEGITNKSFALDLKRIRYKSFIQSCALTQWEEPDWWKDTPAYLIKDIGDIFNFNYWFFWEEDPEDDYLIGFKDLDMERIKQNEEIFKKNLREILPERSLIELVQENEVLLSNSSSSCYSDKYKKVWQAKESENFFSRDPLIGKRTIIPVSPVNYRDSIKLSVPQSNSVKLIEQQCRLICEKLPYSAYFRSPEKFHNKWKNFQDKNTFFFDRDIEKEGITKPRILLKWILEVLEETYPDFPSWKYKGIYNDYFLILENGEIINPTRGHGLGMANALTTIMQCTIFSVIAEKIATSGEFIIAEIDALFYNDDCVIGFKNQEDLETYVDLEDEILKDFGILRKLSKSHSGIFNVFCEIYSYPQLNEKRSFILNELYQIFSAYNIVHAKILCQSLSYNVSYEDISLLICEITKFWGFEFYRSESSEPALFGGWIAPKSLGVRLDFTKVDDISYEMLKALYAVEEFSTIKLRFKGPKRTYLDPLFQLFGSSLETGGCDELLNYLQPYDKVGSVFSKLTDRRRMEAFYDGLQKKRLQIFEKRIPRLLTKKEIFLYIKERYPKIDFVPSDDIDGKKVKIYRNDDFKPYQTCNPLLSYLEFHNPGKICRNVIPYPKGVGIIQPLSRGLTSEERNSLRRYEEYRTGNSTDFMFFTDFSTTYLPKEAYEYYNDANSVATMYNTIYWKNEPCIPLIGEKKFLLPFHFYLLNMKDYQAIVVKLNEIYGWSKTERLIENIDVTIEAIEKVYEKSSKKKKMFNHRNVNEESEPEGPKYLFKNYWDWVADSIPQFEPFVIYDTFQSLYRMIAYYQLFDGSMANRGTRDSNSLVSRDPLVKLAWRSSGGKVKDHPGGTFEIVLGSNLFDGGSDQEEGILSIFD